MSFRKSLMTGAAVACALSALPAAAQQLVLEEIVVTSKLREQNLQEVPLAITVFSEGELERLGVKNVQDLASFTPNFNIYSGNGRQDASAINVRGLSANTSDERYQPVSFFVDGIFMGGITVGLDTANVQRIEVMKGPQSSTFGRATYAGAIDMITKTPSLEEFGGRVNLELSSNTFDNTSYELSGLIEGPIIQDKLSVSLFVKHSLADGFDQAPGAQFDEVGEEKTTAFNAVIYSQLGENTSLKLRGIYAEENDQEALYHTTQPLYWDQNGANIITLPSGALFVQGNVPDPIRDGIRGVDLNDPTIADPNGGGYDRKRYFGSAILDHDFESGFNASYRGSYLFNKYDAFVDFRGRTLVGVDPVFGPTLPLVPVLENSFNFQFPFPFQEEFEETSHQVRFLSPGDEDLRWSVGAYYFWSRDSNFQQRTDAAPPAGNPDRQTRGDENIINYAAFASVAYDITDQLTFSLEGRLQKEEVTFQQLDGLAVSSGSRLSEDLTEKNTSFEPRVTLDYRVNDDQLLYAMFAKGTKSGRWNTSTTAPLLADGTRPSAGFLFAPPEKLYNYEVGSKSTLMDGRAILNIAAFYQDVKDQQLRQSVQTTVDLNGDGQPDNLNQIFTAGDSRIWGFEVEGTAQVSEKLTMRAAVGYSDHEFTDDITPSADFDLFDFGGGARSLKGKTSVNVPKLTATASADYVTPIMGGDFDWRLRGDMVYTGSKYTELANLAKIDDYFLFNVRTGLETEAWNLNLFVNNVFNDKTAQGAGLTGTSTCEFERNGPNLPAYNSAQRCIYLVPQRGREWGVSATFNF